jgi:hypothetical protein
MSSTSTNKQPLLIDRPLFDSVRVTTQIAGAANTLFVQGGQAPAILVDMDANLSEDNNSGGVIDSITIVRNDDYRDVDHTVSSGTSGTPISFVSGQIAQIVVPASLRAPERRLKVQLVLHLYRIRHSHWN